MAIVAPSARAGVSGWSSVVASDATVDTFPKAYGLAFGFAQNATVHLKATCACGAQTLTFKIQGSLDGTNYFDETFMDDTTVLGSYALTGTEALDKTVILGRVDSATVFHPGVFYPTYRALITSSGGTPQITGVTVEYYAPGRTRY
jgi:hypothetical protein